MLAAPVETPVTTPDAETVALEVGELLHEPPVPVLLSVTVEPVQTIELPEIVPALGGLLTVTLVVTVVAPQVFVLVQLMVTEPALTPFTTADAYMVATAVLPDVHVPPPIVSPKVRWLPTHTLVVPVMGFKLGTVFTVTGLVDILLPQALVNV